MGNLQWQKCYGGDSSDIASSVFQTSDNGYIIGGLSGSDNFDVHGNHGRNDNWIIKTDSLGNLQWEKCIGGTGDEIQSMTRNQTTIQINERTYKSIICTSQKNGDMFSNHAPYGTLIFDLTTDYNTISGKTFVDFNSNTVKDSSDSELKNKRVSEINTGRFSFSDQNGDYHLYVPDTGNFSVAPSLLNYYAAIPSVHAVNFFNFNQIDSANNFAFQPTGTFDDLCISISPIGRFRTGSNASYMINYVNEGTSTISPTVIFFPYSNTSYVSASVIPLVVTSDSITWNLPALSPFQTGSILVTVHINAGLPIGTLINSSVRIDPVAGDANPSCNYAAWEVYTTGSFDPNEIVVDRDTVFTYEFSSPPYLDYVIYFQNVGNDTAFNVKVLNNIPENLDLSTFELVATSHPLNIIYSSPAQLMEFDFDNILLPDKVVNEPGSHGFVRYRIKPLPTLVGGDSISNQGAIYFDFNQPVLTNSAITRIVFSVGISNVNSSSGKLVMIPNPTTGKLKVENKESKIKSIELYNLLGEKKYALAVDSNQKEVTIDLTKLSAGIYFVQASDGEKVWRGKVVKE